MNHNSLNQNILSKSSVNITTLSIQLTSILKARNGLKYVISWQKNVNYQEILENITAPDGFLPALAVTSDKLWIFLSGTTLGPILQKDQDTKTGYQLIGFQSSHYSLILMSILQVCNLITEKNILHLEKLPLLNRQFTSSVFLKNGEEHE